MTKEEQIEQMVKVIKSSLDGLGCGNFNFTGDEISMMFAKTLYSENYRKQSEVAREIFELIDCAFSPVLVYNGYTIKEYLAELKKKYTGGTTDERKQTQCKE